MATSDTRHRPGLLADSVPALIATVLLAGCAQAPAPPPSADAVAAPGLYQLPADATPDATLRAVVLRGGTTARGTLSANGQRFPVVLQGLGVAAPAPARLDVAGQLFGLEHTADVEGTYRMIGPGGTPTELAGGLQLGNANLVVLRIRPGREGAVLTAPAEGVTLILGR